jgi:DNA-binding beta-propeller fold protein YncE
MRMRLGILGMVAVAACCGPAMAQEARATDFTVRPTVSMSDGKATVAFEVDAATDVEVAVLDGEGAVVRHLAAGVLGGQSAPPPPLKPGLAQSLTWDGKDDYGQQATGGPFKVRVRAGMGVKLEQIVGGNPYMYFYGGHGDHNRWGITGVELKSDGKVYVVGHSTMLGPVAIRQYDVDGNYQRTVFPPPAGKDPEAMKGWGIHVKPDGTYAVRFCRLTDPSVGTTIVDTELSMARLMPTPGPDRLTLWQGLTALTINTDGTIPPAAEQISGLLVSDPPIRTATMRPDGPVFTCFSPDGKFFYLSGVYGADRGGNRVGEGFWCDGQVWKVDAATRKATPFFALDSEALAELTRGGRDASKKLLGGIMSYAALHGVAVDADGHVFVANRLGNCVLVLDKDAKVVGKVPVKHPDAVAVSARTGALYVTTRYGCEYSGRGKVGLVKFNDWQTAGEPSVSLPDLSNTWYTDQHKHSYVVLCEKADCTNVWVAYTEMPVRVYKDDGKDFSLIRDFHALTAEQGCCGFDRLAVDRKTDTVYVGDNHSTFWRVSDWKQPRFERVPVKAASLAVDPQKRFLYANPGGSVWQKDSGIFRYHLDPEGCPPAKAGDTNRLTGRLWSEWCFTGNSDLGFDVAPNGNIAGIDQKGNLLFFHGTEDKAPWESTKLVDLGPSGAYGCVQFDPAGNLYVGARHGQWKTTPVFQGDSFTSQGGRSGCTKIIKYAPTGTLEGGNLFPTAPGSPAAVYEVNFGAFDASCIHHVPRFNVDEFGRILYPTSIQPRVSLIDNAGNEILHFGTWGNRDSTGGLPEDLVPTQDIPMGLPDSVAATDDHVYVADMVNLRVLRIAKTFAASETAPLK